MAELLEKISTQELLVVSDVPHQAEEKEEETSTAIEDRLNPSQTRPVAVPNKDEQQNSYFVPEADELLMPLNPNKSPLHLSQNPPKTCHLPDNEKNALFQLKQLLQQALNNHQFGTPKPEKQTTPMEVDDGAKTLEAIEETIVPRPQQVSIWGVKLLQDDRSNVVLLKFLQARDFNVNNTFTMISNTLKWRNEFNIDELVEEDDNGCSEFERAVFMHGVSKQGNPVCYNVYGQFRNAELYHKTFFDEEKRRKFLRWRIKFLEKTIRKLDFTPSGVSTIVYVNDLKNSPGPNRWELRQATNQALQLLQDNYPEFVAKQIFINVPWWYLALSKLISPFLTQRTKSKFVVATPSNSTDTLFKYIDAEQIPTQYGGLSKDGEFGVDDSVTEIIVKPFAKHIVEFPLTQGCIASWEARVVGREVRYGAEFVPSAQETYTIIIHKISRIGPNEEEQIICGSYKAGEPGKLLLTIDNLASKKKKKLLYRFKTKFVN